MLDNQSDLESLLKLCRKQGVTEITIDGINIKFGELPSKQKRAKVEDVEEEQAELNPDELIYYAVQNQQPIG